MTEVMRDSGIDIIGSVPWGTHFCHFFETREDIVDILVPFFKAGLDANEFCMWVTCDPVTVDVAGEALAARIPDLERHLSEGRIEIVPYDEWYLLDGVFDMDRVFAGWRDKLSKALDRGMDGLRATGNTAWLEKADWQDFAEYEEELERIIRGYPMIAVCTYSLEKCSASQVLDVVRNHEYALTKQQGSWRLIETSERKRIADSLRRTEERYRRIVETASEGVWLTDRDGLTTFVNDSMLEMLGHARDEVLGHHLLEFVEVENRAQVEDTVARVGAGEKAFTDTAFKRRDGAVLHAMVSSAPILDAEGRCDGGLWMVTDITERKKAEEQLVRVNRELDGYARTLSHDLRSPLSSIALANSLSSESLDEERIEHIRSEVGESCESIARNVERCFALTTNLLALARAGQEPQAVEDIDVSEVVASILEERETEFRLRRVEIDVPREMGHVRADQTHVYQLFSNLISNAVKHNDSESPRVTVRNLGGTGNGAHRYLVRDNGPGIPPADMESIFVPFVRKGPNADTGIGLAIVDKVVRLYGGEISVRNEGGACFEFTLFDKRL